MSYEEIDEEIIDMDANEANNEEASAESSESSENTKGGCGCSK